MIFSYIIIFIILFSDFTYIMVSDSNFWFSVSFETTIDPFSLCAKNTSTTILLFSILVYYKLL